MEKQMRGIYAILPTPYKENLELDYDDLRRCVDFCVATKTHGIVIPVNASEFHLMNDEERKQVIKVTAEHAAGRVPVVAGVAGKTTEEAVELAAYADAAGADAVISMPPYITHVPDEEVFDFYRRLDGAVHIPIYVQNFLGPIGTPMSVPMMMKMCAELENVKYIKEETARSPQVLSKIREEGAKLPEGSFMGVMGGMSGRQIIQEFDRGACGCMPTCVVADVLAELWNMLEAGERDSAKELLLALMPIISYDGVYPIIAYKEILRRRGAIRNAATRSKHWGSLDAANQKEISEILDDLKPYFRV